MEAPGCDSAKLLAVPDDEVFYAWMSRRSNPSTRRL